MSCFLAMLWHEYDSPHMVVDDAAWLDLGRHVFSVRNTLAGDDAVSDSLSSGQHRRRGDVLLYPPERAVPAQRSIVLGGFDGDGAVE